MTSDHEFEKILSKSFYNHGERVVGDGRRGEVVSKEGVHGEFRAHQQLRRYKQLKKPRDYYLRLAKQLRSQNR